MALMAWESKKCPSCGNYDTLVPLQREAYIERDGSVGSRRVDRDVTWTEHGNRVMRVRQFRCLTCGAADVVRRDFGEKHKDDTPVPNQAMPADGRMFVASPLTEEA